MRDFGEMISNMEKEFINGKIEVDTKVILKMVIFMAKAEEFTLQEIFTWANFNFQRRMDLVK